MNQVRQGYRPRFGWWRTCNNARYCARMKKLAEKEFPREGLIFTHDLVLRTDQLTSITAESLPRHLKEHLERIPIYHADGLVIIGKAAQVEYRTPNHTIAFVVIGESNAVYCELPEGIKARQQRSAE